MMSWWAGFPSKPDPISVFVQSLLKKLSPNPFHRLPSGSFCPVRAAPSSLSVEQFSWRGMGQSSSCFKHLWHLSGFSLLSLFQPLYWKVFSKDRMAMGKRTEQVSCWWHPLFFNVPSKEKCLALTGLTSHPLRKGEGRWKWVTRQLKNAFWIRRYFLNYFMHFINKIAWLTNEGGHQFFFFYGLTLRPLFFSVLGACKNRNTKNVLYLRQWWQGGNIKNNKHIRKRCVFSRNCTNCGFTAQCNRKRCKKKPPNTRKHDTKSKYGKWVCSADHKFNMQLWGQCSSALLTLIGCVMWLVTVIGRPSLCPDWAGETPKRETSAHESYLFLSRPSSRFLGNEINFIMSPISPCRVLAF